MNERIVFTNLDGSCGILIPTGEISIEEVMEKDVPTNAINVRYITTNDLPVDRVFRNAWDDSNPENYIGLDLDKAKLIVHERRRVDREEKLLPLDKEQNYASTSQVRRDAILLEKLDILESNALLQVDIDRSNNESELRNTLIQDKE